MRPRVRYLFSGGSLSDVFKTLASRWNSWSMLSSKVVDARGRGNRIVVVGVEGGRDELRRRIGPGGRS